MILKNNIGWCDDTGNKVTGCDKVSLGCKNCYAQVGTRARVLRAQGIETWGPNGQRYPVKNFGAKARRLNRYKICDRCHSLEPTGSDDCRKCQDSTLRRIRLFADSNSDWLDEKWPIETLADLLKDIHDCPNVDFLLLTKRPENFISRLEAAKDCLGRTVADPKSSNSELIRLWLYRNAAPHNVWIGVSVEDQKRADERIPLLLKIPAKVRFLSVEPLLERVTLLFAEGRGHTTQGPGITNKIDWVIVGGESGLGRRDCGWQAIRDVAEQCVRVHVPVFVKQASALKPGQQGDLPPEIWAFKQFPR